MALVKCVDCEFVGQKTNNAGVPNPAQRCEKRAPEANQAEEGLARYPIVELADGGCHEGSAPVPPSQPATKSGKK